MKKSLILLAAVILGLASCDKGANKYTSLRFKNADVTIAVGAKERLQVLYEPTTLEYPQCEWSTSNPQVVKVDQNGTIEAIAVGEANVTAKVGDLEAVCKVSVKTIYDLLSWNMVLMAVDENDPSTAIGSPYEVGTQTKYKVQKFAGTFYLCGEGIDYVNGVGISGAGFMSFVDCPIEVIIEGEYAGYVWTNEILFTDASPADSAGVYPAGALTNAQEWYTYLTDTTYKGDGSFKGAAIHYVDWDAQAEADYLGFIKDGILVDYYSEDVEQVYYRMNITWMGGVCGLEYDSEKDDFVLPPTFAEREDKQYENLPEEAISAQVTPRAIQSMPKNVMQNRNFQNIRVLMHK